MTSRVNGAVDVDGVHPELEAAWGGGEREDHGLRMEFARHGRAGALGIRGCERQLEMCGVLMIRAEEGTARNPRKGLGDVAVTVGRAVADRQLPRESARRHTPVLGVRGGPAEEELLPDLPGRSCRGRVDHGHGRGVGGGDDDRVRVGETAGISDTQTDRHGRRRRVGESRRGTCRVIEGTVAVKVPGVGECRHPQDRSSCDRRTRRSGVPDQSKAQPGQWRSAAGSLTRTGRGGRFR